MKDKNDVTWEDLKKRFEELKRQKEENGGLNDAEDKSEEFKKLKAKVLGHLDNLQAEQDKKIISFPKEVG